MPADIDSKTTETTKSDDKTKKTEKDEKTEKDGKKTDEKTEKADDKEKTAATDEKTADKLFTKSNIIIVLWFLGTYLVVSSIMGLTSTNYSVPNDRIVIITRMIDFIILIFLVIGLIISYFYKSDEDKEKIVENLYRSLVEYMDKPITIVTVAVFLCVFYMLIMLIGIPMDRNKPVTVRLVENVAWIFIALLLIAGFFKYVLHISMSELLENGFEKLWKADEKSAESTDDEESQTKKKASKSDGKNEVFNISNNLYTYDDAQAACKSLNSRLATYEEVENAYNDGAEWCNYGWSDNQSIYFPTQKSTWDKLQKTKNHKNDCGRPGVNGGYIDNPHVRFGANCYGVKPPPTEKERTYMAADKTSIAPKTPEETLAEQKVKFFKKHRSEFIRLNSFDSNKWSAL
jgi:hypothetical protein